MKRRRIEDFRAIFAVVLGRPQRLFSFFLNYKPTNWMVDRISTLIYRFKYTVKKLWYLIFTGQRRTLAKPTKRIQYR